MAFIPATSKQTLQASVALRRQTGRPVQEVLGRHEEQTRLHHVRRPDSRPAVAHIRTEPVVEERWPTSWVSRTYAVGLRPPS